MAAALAVFLSVVGISCSSAPPAKQDGALDAGGDGRSDAMSDDGKDAPPPAADARAETDSPPTVRENGLPCTRAGQCQSGACSEGVCCDQPCKEACRSCVIIGSLGVCLPAKVGTDPRGECPDEGEATCGRDGACDGAGACRRYPAGTVCQQPSCTGSVLTVARRCDGSGSCREPISEACDPYTCGPDGRCLTTCATDKECIAGKSCDPVTGCGKKPLGASCNTLTECNSGFCEQGVCCAGECQGTCWSCALTGSVGVCTPTPAGDVDTQHRCSESAVSLCGLDSRCDGFGGCRVYPEGTECAPAACDGPGYRTQKTCSGSGACLVRPSASCGRYRCAAGSCFTACISAAECAAPYQCVDGNCIAACGAQFSFENGTEQRWMANQFAATALGSPVNDGTLAFCGTRALKSVANYGVDSAGELFVPLSAATDFTGKTIVYNVYLDGRPLPAMTRAFGVAMKGVQFFSGPTTDNLVVGTWNRVSYAPNTTADRIGLRLSMPAGQVWNGDVYLDEVSW
jgi:hypothetical protein